MKEMTNFTQIYKGVTFEERELGERRLSFVNQHVDDYVRMYDNTMKVAFTQGWHGVGRSRIVKYTAERFKGSEGYGSDVIWIDLRRDSSPRKVQMKIAESLGIYSEERARDDDDDGDDDDDDSSSSSPVHSIALNICIKLLRDDNLKLLLVLDNMQNDIDLTTIGVPIQMPWDTTAVLVTFPPHKLYFPSLQLDRKLELGEFSTDNFDIELLVGGARDVADSLQMHYNIKREPETILCCFFYLFLFPEVQGYVKEEELWRFYMGEGLVPFRMATSDVNSIIEASTMIKTVVEEMIFHSIFERENASNAVLIASELWKLIKNKHTVLYCQDVLSIHKSGDHNDKTNWISLAKKDIRTRSMLSQQLSESFVKKYSNLTTLLLCDNPQLEDIPDDFFENMRSLRVLDLSTTAISSLPSSLSQLRNCLKFLKLRNCCSLQTIPPSMKHLESLQLLDLYNTPLSNTIPDDSFEGMYNLQLLDLSYAKIVSLPTSISNCNRLELLFLRGCRLKSLFLIPNTNIKKILLADCTGLEGMIVPHLQLLSALEELDISGCTALKGNSFDGQMPKLRVLNLSKTRFASVSLKGCWNLETVHLQHLTKLEFLDLSGTKIREFPSEISQLTRLKRLDLVGTRKLKIFHWNEVEKLPKLKVLNWDQCGFYNKSIGDGSRAFISVSSVKLFQGLSNSSPLWSNCLETSEISIAPCGKQLQRRSRKDTAYSTKDITQSVYGHLYCTIKGRPVNYSRSLEIEGFKSLNDLDTSLINMIARRVQFLSMRDCLLNDDVSYVLLRDTGELKEFRIERCRNMRNIFSEISNLGTLWVSQFSDQEFISRYDYLSFDSLRHLYLGSCHKVNYIFHRISLPNLETLQVHSCATLEEIFSHSFSYNSLQRLHTIQLWDLPLLKSICNIYLPTLKKLRVRGCAALQKLPLFSPLPLTESNLSSVEIEGESDWCDNLEWMSDNLKWMEGIEKVHNDLRHPIILKRYHHPFTRKTDLVFKHQM